MNIRIKPQAAQHLFVCAMDGPASCTPKVRDDILAHVRHDLMLDCIARAVGISTFSIQRHFKERFGTSVSGFIRQKRLETARAAMERNGTSISRAAYLDGYRNPSSFFKKACGVTPKHRQA